MVHGSFLPSEPVPEDDDNKDDEVDGRKRLAASLLRGVQILVSRHAGLLSAHKQKKRKMKEAAT